MQLSEEGGMGVCWGLFFFLGVAVVAEFAVSMVLKDNPLLRLGEFVCTCDERQDWMRGGRGGRSIRCVGSRLLIAGAAVCGGEALAE